MISSGAERSDHLSPRFSASAPRALWEDGPWSRGLFPAPDDTQMLSHPFSLCVPDAMATSPWLGKKTEISPEISKHPPGQEWEGGTGMPGPTIPSSVSGNTSSEEGRGNIRAAWRKTSAGSECRGASTARARLQIAVLGTEREVMSDSLRPHGL